MLRKPQLRVDAVLLHCIDDEGDTQTGSVRNVHRPLDNVKRFDHAVVFFSPEADKIILIGINPISP